MANIRVNLTEPLLNGMDIKFKAPCDCTAVTGLEVQAPDNDGNMASQTFTFKDAGGNTLTGLGNLFAKDALVKVMVDTTNSSAYIQNAATNKYLENKIANAGGKIELSSSVSSTSTTTAANSYAVKQAYDKAVSASNAASNAIPSSQKGAASGVAPLNGSKKIDNTYIGASGSLTFTSSMNYGVSASGTYIVIGKMLVCFVSLSGTLADSTFSFIYTVSGLPGSLADSVRTPVGGYSYNNQPALSVTLNTTSMEVCSFEGGDLTKDSRFMHKFVITALFA